MKLKAWKAGLTFGMTMGMGLVAGCDNPADQTPAAIVGEATLNQGPPAAETMAAEGTPEALPTVTTYSITPENSKLEFVGSKVTGSHPCGFSQFDGRILMAGPAPTDGQVEFTIDMNSVWSESGRLTDHLKSDDFFAVATHPTSTFVSTGIAPGEGGQFNVTGQLTLHGVTKQITFPAAITVAEDVVTATANFDIKRFDFGIVYSGQADNLIRDEVVIKIDLKAQREAAPAA